MRLSYLPNCHLSGWGLEILPFPTQNYQRTLNLFLIFDASFCFCLIIFEGFKLFFFGGVEGVGWGGFFQ